MPIWSTGWLAGCDWLPSWPLLAGWPWLAGWLAGQWNSPKVFKFLRFYCHFEIMTSSRIQK